MVVRCPDSRNRENECNERNEMNIYNHLEQI